MKGIRRDMQRVEFFIRHDDPGWIGALVVLRMHGQTGGGGAGDALDQGFEAGQRPAPPGATQHTEQPVLDLVPLAGARGEVTDLDGQVPVRRPALCSAFHNRTR